VPRGLAVFCFLMRMGNAICMLAGTPTLAAAIALIVAKPIVSAPVAWPPRRASVHAVADREGVMKL